MANEVIIEEYASINVKYPDGSFAPIPGELITTQVLNITELSAAFNPRTSFIRIQSKTTGFWYILGTSAASAVADTDGNRWIPADQFRDIGITPGTHTNIDTAA